jgi:Ser/Thr protein kinase RdoA (MazF antagonist)
MAAFLAEAGFPTPLFLASKEGVYAVRTGERDLTLRQWVPGRVLSHGDLTAARREKLGRLLGRSHQLLLSFPTRQRLDWSGESRAAVIEALTEAAGYVRGRGPALPGNPEALAAIEEALAELGSIGDIEAVVAACLEQAVTGDFGLRNLVWDADDSPTLIDLRGGSEGRVGELLYAAGELHGEEMPVAFDAEVVANLMRGYAQEVRLTPEEIRFGPAYYRLRLLWQRQVLSAYGLQPTAKRGAYGVTLVRQAAWLKSHGDELARQLAAAYD